MSKSDQIIAEYKAELASIESAGYSDRVRKRLITAAYAKARRLIDELQSQRPPRGKR